MCPGRGEVARSPVAARSAAAFAAAVTAAALSAAFAASSFAFSAFAVAFAAFLGFSLRLRLRSLRLGFGPAAACLPLDVRTANLRAQKREVGVSVSAIEGVCAEGMDGGERECERGMRG